MNRKWKSLKELIPQDFGLFEIAVSIFVGKAIIKGISSQETVLYCVLSLIGFANRLAKHLQPHVEVQEKIVEYRMDLESTEKLAEFERKLNLIAMKTHMKI